MCWSLLSAPLSHEARTPRCRRSGSRRSSSPAPRPRSRSTASDRSSSCQSSPPSPFSWNLLQLLNSRPLQKQTFHHAHRVTHSWTRFPYSVLQKNIHDKQIFQQARFQVSDFEASFKKSQMFMNRKIMTVLIGQCPICRVMIALTPQTICF